ncbi:phosphatase PAP2 family protein [Solwaraspora sp. WMMB335]|uniref:phosphatase PAP2 family protein n=1 Tax=Solwaraspora sp. WMMB335 TaxID=3404118 RepID=UPI003B928779
MIARPPLAVPLLATVALAALTVLLAVEPAILARVDAPVVEWFRAFGDDRPALIAVVRIATDVAATVPFLAAGAGATVVFAARSQRARAWFCATATVAVPTGWALGQALLHRPRPADGFVTIAASGFPSGHTANASATAFAVALLVWPAARRGARGLLVTLAVVGVAAVAATRLLLLAHWPADVVGGVLLAVTVVSLAASWTSRRGREPGWPPPADRQPGMVSSRDGSCEVRRP